MDAGASAADCHAAVARFNAGGSRAVAFLLHARAAGLGIDLPSVSTVVVLDSDWNPRCALSSGPLVFVRPQPKEGGRACSW